MISFPWQVNWEAFLLEEIAQPNVTRSDVAQTYSYLLADTKTDWRRINQMIIQKWGKGGLARIKREAWKRLRKNRALSEAEQREALGREPVS